MHKIMKYPA